MDDDFFELGGDSLAAEALLAALAEELGVPGRELSADLLMEHPTVKDFAAAVDRRRSELPPPASPRARPDAPVALAFLAGAGVMALVQAVVRRLRTR
jgi:hypothetical protein